MPESRGAMATATEESFKVCGLCSQLVDESVEITTSMRAFLCGFLMIEETTLPSKICLECYQRSMESRSFKERCDKAIHKLHKSALYSSMILGGSPAEIAMAQSRSAKDDQKLAKAERRTAAMLDAAAGAPPLPHVQTVGAADAKMTAVKKAGPKSKQPKMLVAPPPEPEPELEDAPRATRSGKVATPSSTRLRSKGPTSPAPAESLQHAGPRATRGSSGASAAVVELPPTPPQPAKGVPQKSPVARKSSRAKQSGGERGLEAKVSIKFKEKQLAEGALHSFSSPPPQQQQQQVNGLGGSRKRKGNFSTPSSGGGGGGDATPTGKRQKVDEVQVVSKNRTSSGRVVKANKSKGFIFDDVGFGGGKDGEGRNSGGGGGGSNQVVARKSTPPAKHGGGNSTPKTATGGGGKKSLPAASKKKPQLPTSPPPKEPAAEAPAAATGGGSDDEDMEEIFPTVGPYQCEICQKITDTKQEFVDHIKKLHIEVVDEEVLRSLEGDLRKSRKKAELASSKSAGKQPPNSSLSSSSSSSSSKKTGPASKKSSKAATTPKSSPRKEASSSASITKQKREPSVESRTCKICQTVLSTALKADHERHRMSKYCLRIAAEGGAAAVVTNSAAAEDSFTDPLSTESSGKKGGRKMVETADEVAQRTCQFCGKVLCRKSDLPSHYKTKACVAKQYEREAKQGLISNGGVEASGGGSQASVVVVENAEVDEGYPASATKMKEDRSYVVGSGGGDNNDDDDAAGGRNSSPNLPSSTTNDEHVVDGGGHVSSVEHSMVAKLEHVPSPMKGGMEDSATSTTNRSLNDSSEWSAGAPITTIADTLGGAMMQQGGVDPLMMTAAPSEDSDPFGQTPNTILGNGAFVSPPDGGNVSMF